MFSFYQFINYVIKFIFRLLIKDVLENANVAHTTSYIKQFIVRATMPLFTALLELNDSELL